MPGIGGPWLRKTKWISAIERPGTATVEPNLAHIRHFGTHPAWAKREIGRAIYRLCESGARAAGATTLECYSTLNGEAFYAALGFESIAREFGWDARFEGYVARSLADFIDDYDPVRDRLWLADADDALVGSVAIVHAPGDVAQLRWFLVNPVARGRGLGRRLLDDAVDFCRAAGYGRVFLLTVRDLEVAARLYREAGFVLADEEPEQLWGARVVVQRYELAL